MLPADEQAIARYGTEASNGVILITLRYDTPARFPEADGSFNDYISAQTDWDDSLPAARVVLRYKITTDGRTVPTDELEATDRRLRRRVIDAVEKAPRWQPAMRDGKPVESEGFCAYNCPKAKHSAPLGIHHALNPTKPLRNLKTNSLSAWILAIRPYSLGNSVILILIGSALAFTDGGFRPVVALLCLVFAVTMQCTANLVNDLCDFLKGADRPDRLGPDRAFAKGYITLRAMKSGIAAFTLAACAAGVGLLALSGWNWWLLLVGASCIVFAYFYTAGPWPLAYHGMGDIAVILFFGLIPVGFTYYLQCGT